ncbi:VPA1262 family N-terminal domain-containing protein [Cupriavidus basilensis]|uniref:VPA1262 family N-terminal domain-containing protein n=1 Tax=Cupriavidus basilensis TaxID=68895 RepID=UPI0020A67DFE|nr:VPA1262 family N-terminal domain-containing protein [Cupriavidus basilensis]MCP3024295.1 VPA1262 family N-terminal domain-containing protein [Cupriavidus basilensis]
MQKKTIFWDVARTLAKLDELVKPGVVGFYRSVEVTEVLGVQGKAFTNFLTLAVAEPLEATSEIDWKSVLLNGKERHRLPGTEWDVGIAQYRLPLKTFLEKVVELGTTGQWKPAPISIQTGTLAAVPPQFVPSDGSDHHPWNGVLKNNFFEGSHVLELFDTTKQHVRFLLDDSRRLTNLAKIVGGYLPIKVDGMSDRLGNVIIQLPVTVMSTAVRGSPEGDHSVAVVWHPDVPHRNVRIAAEIWQDSTVTSFDSAVISAGEAKLQLNSPGGGARTHIWDEEKHILLSATPPVTFFTSAHVSVSVDHPRNEPVRREFLLADSAGEQLTQSLELINPVEPRRLIGSIPEVPREPWVSQRVFGESVASLKARKEFVQYGLDEPKEQDAAEQQAAKGNDTDDEDTEGEDTTPETTSRKLGRRMAALEDLRWLIAKHGGEGVWLWDPFLNADDVLRTLYFCPHNGVPLRALTAGKRPPGDEQKKNEDEMSQRDRERLARERAKKNKREQGEQLEAAKGNCHGLQLEFRIREGSAGWGFHDRFIIFPRAQGSALAWSLGTSINSFGNEHHILQKVSHGEPIAQAFKDLWERLEGARYLIWKTPRNEGQEQ